MWCRMAFLCPFFWFTSEMVTEEVLAHELGIQKFGHRHRILGALTEESLFSLREETSSSCSACLLM